VHVVDQIDSVPDTTVLFGQITATITGGVTVVIRQNWRMWKAPEGYLRLDGTVAPYVSTWHGDKPDSHEI
jgi:hypothetical protein